MSWPEDLIKPFLQLDLEEPELLLGALPDFAGRLTLPEGARVLASVAQRRAAHVAVLLEVPSSAEAFVPTYVERLLLEGWTREPPLGPPDRGQPHLFADLMGQLVLEEPIEAPPTRDDTFDERRFLRGGEERLEFRALPRTAPLRVHLRYDVNGLPMTEEERWGGLFEHAPQLSVPPGAVAQGSYSTLGALHAEGRLTLSGAQPYGALLEHFSVQLSSQGWSIQERLLGSRAGSLSATRTLPGGEPYLLLLTCLEMRGNRTQVHLMIQNEREDDDSHLLTAF